jgi:hypothetical protein
MDVPSRATLLKTIACEMKFPEFKPVKEWSEERDRRGVRKNLHEMLPDKRPVRNYAMLESDCLTNRTFNRRNYREVPSSTSTTSSTSHSCNSRRSCGHEVSDFPILPHWEARRLVGSITPKIISTASTIAGLACIEFIKVRGISDRIFIATNNFQVQLGYTKLAPAEQQQRELKYRRFPRK